MDNTGKLTVKVVSSDGQIKTEETTVISEHTLSVIINEQPAYSIVCTKDHLRELVVGRLVTDGIIKGKDEIGEISFRENESEATVVIDSDHIKKRHESVPKKLPECDLKSEWIFKLAEEFRRGAPIHDLTGASHICILAREGNTLFTSEDISRHTAVDKAVGYAVLNDIPLSECMIFTSGRVPADMTEKVIAAGIPVLVSKSVPTEESVKLAEEYNLKLICRSWPDQYEVFT